MKHLQTLDKIGQKKEFSKSILIKSGQKIDIETITKISSSKTIGNICIKAVVMPDSSLNLKGIIKVGPKLAKVEAFLKHSILLIGKNSTAVSIPELEIESNDVQVSHSSTIGQIDSEQLFYLMSRGITYTDSINLIIKSFLSSN